MSRALPSAETLPNSSENATNASPWKQRGRFWGWGLVQAWLVFHLFAIAISPASVAPTSKSEVRAYNATAWYSETLYLNHGYHYFAPEPAESTLLGYELKFADGHQEQGRLPTKTIKPRLLYHRHFMLTEFLADIEDMEQPLKDEILRSYAHQLCRQFGAVSVKLTKVTHNLSSMERIRAGGQLDDPESYEEAPLGEFPEAPAAAVSPGEVTWLP